MDELEDELWNWYRTPYNEQEWISKEDMQVGLYLADARNFTTGYWNGEVFEYTRTKFGGTFQDVEYHYDDGAPFSTVKPIRYLGAVND